MANFLDKILRYSGKCIVYDGLESSYKDLANKIEEKSSTISNLPKGSTIALIGDYDIDSIAFLLCCYKHKMIVAPLSNPNKDSINEANLAYIYQNGKLEATNNTCQNSLLSNLKSGLILFSSGSTGKPKAILHDLDSILDSYVNKKQKRINLLLFLGFDHIGGLNTLFNALSMGGCGIALKDRKNIKAIAKALQDYKISLLPASPSLLNLMLACNIQDEYDLSHLKVITYGSEAMPPSLLERLRLAFPKVRFHQTFGTSETGIIQTKSLKDAIKLENVDYKIIDGELYLKSKTQSLGYLNADNNAFDSDGYFATGDLVEEIEYGDERYLKIIGRNKEIINVGGEKVMPNEVEGIVLELPYILDCLVYGEKNSITGQSVSIKVVLDTKAKDMNNIELKKRIRIHCKGKLAPYKVPTKVEILESIAMSERFKKIRSVK